DCKPRACDGFLTAQGVGSSGRGSDAARAHHDPRSRRASPGGSPGRNCSFRGSVGPPRQPAIYGTTLLVLSGAANARGRATAGGPACRGGGSIPTRAQARTGKRLVLLRASPAL